jgi:uridine phosphorylase
LLNKKSEIVIVDDKLYHLGIKKSDLAENIFIVGDPARAFRVSQEFDQIDCEISNREYLTFTGSYRGIPVSVIGTGIGTDNVEIALVEAYIAHEFDLKSAEKLQNCSPLTIIRLGTSGGVQPDVTPGSLAISSYALGLDSTGIYYEQPAEDLIVERIETEASKILNSAISKKSRFKGKITPYASKASSEVTMALINQAEAYGVEFETGITVSSPGFYGPSSRYIEGLNNTLSDIKGSLSSLNIDGLKVHNMEMESSLFFHLCSQLGYRAGTICTVISGPNDSDSIIDYEAAIGNTIRIGLNALVELNDD